MFLPACIMSCLLWVRVTSAVLDVASAVVGIGGGTTIADSIGSIEFNVR